LALSRHRDPFDIEPGLDSATHAADEIERERFRISHSDVGACILSSWGLPDDIVSVAAWHHDARRFARGASDSCALFVAAACAFQSNRGDRTATAELKRLNEVLVGSDREENFERWRRVAAGAGAGAA
jgi:HD-like signal output (HDOD) protein